MAVATRSRYSFPTYGECEAHGAGVQVEQDMRTMICTPCRDGNVKTIATSVRKIEIDNTKPKSGRPCGAICTSGKRSCDCRCNGRCHGAGKCLGGHD
jgi:hypothetical protein